MKTAELTPFVKYVFAWIALPFIATLNAVLRELTYCHMAGEHTAHQISAVIFSVLISFFVVALNSRLTLSDAGEAIKVGALWLLFTVVFDVAIGFLLGMPIAGQIEQYNIANGNLRVLVLISMFISPLVFRKYKVLHHPV
jgi:hypothetical protein